MWPIIPGVPTTKATINVATFVSYVLPPLLFYFAMAVMVIMPHTRALRLALWPVVVLSALRAAFSVHIASTPNNSDEKFHVDLYIPMLLIVTRSLYWGLAREPLTRRYRPLNSSPSTLTDALDLVLTMRGYGWNWSRGLFVPRDTRSSHRFRFVSQVILSLVVHAFICGTCHQALWSFSPIGLGSTLGGSIFDIALPSHLRYFRSSVITIIGCFATYSFLQTVYDLSTVVGVLLLGQDPAQWPPGFDAPWRSTSLAEFWGRRWHQWFRHIFLVQGGYPLSFVFGRAGLVIGAFLSSAVFHHLGVYSVYGASEPGRMLLGFGMMAPGILVEGMFTQMTGKKVGGVVGWVWTMTWLVLWGNLIIDGFAGAALFGPGALIDIVPSWRTFVENLVKRFDAWIHSA